MHEDAFETEDETSQIINLFGNIDDNNKLIKIIDIINSNAMKQKYFYSIEVSPLKKMDLNYNLFVETPAFTAVTWLSDTNINNCPPDSVPPSIGMSETVSKSTPSLLHLSCYKLTELKLNELLKYDLMNIMALRGDFIDDKQPMRYAIELVQSIRQKNNEICIAVGGYPDCHPEAISPQSDIYYLKQKVDAGADFIITQTCFSSKTIINFIEKCRSIGISVPILPGIFVPFSYKSLIMLCKVCCVKVPPKEFEIFKRFRNDTEKFQNFAIDYGVEMIKDLFFNGIYGVHFFTLNQFDLINNVVSKLNIDNKV